MLIAATLLILIHLCSASTQEEGECSSVETRRAAVDKELAAKLSCHFSITLQKRTLGLSADLPGISCAEILRYRAQTPSGYYWLRSTNGSAIYVYCDMTLTCKGVSGGWMQVVKLDMTNSSHQCPPGTRLRTDLPRRLCGSGTSGGCSSTFFDLSGIEYSQVCGKIIGYQDETPDAFGQPSRPISIDNTYVEGISLTHGCNPRKHIWTFAAGLDEVGDRLPALNCPCTNRNLSSSATPPPSFVGDDYFCDTGSAESFQHIFYGDDPLWDGAGCGPLNDCCTLNNPPWFRKQLPSATADDIEMRICRSPAPDEDTPVENIEIYVQ